MPTKQEIQFIESWAPILSEFGEEVPFAAAVYMESERVGLLHLRLAAWDVDGLIESVEGAGYRLTPRGADLLATAQHVDIDALVADDEPVEAPAEPTLIDCPSCEGKGRVPVGLGPARQRTISELVEGLDGGRADPAERLPGWDVTCTTCRGRGKQSVEEVLGVPEYESVERQEPNDGWIKFDTLDNVRHLVGKQVEVKFCGHVFRTGVLSMSNAYALVGGIHTHWIPGRCMREVPDLSRGKSDGWVRDRDGIVSMLRESHATGREFECEWSRSEGLGIVSIGPRVRAISGTKAKFVFADVKVMIGNHQRTRMVCVDAEATSAAVPVITAIRWLDAEAADGGWIEFDSIEKVRHLVGKQIEVQSPYGSASGRLSEISGDIVVVDGEVNYGDRTVSKSGIRVCAHPGRRIREARP